MLIETVTTKHPGDVQTPSTRTIQEQLNLAAREIETSSQACALFEGL
jgi:hypothetical protein